MPSPMQALYKSGKSLQLCQRPVPEPGPGEVRVQMHCAGLCRTDLQVIAGQIPALDPLIPGHEGAGEIVATGLGVSTLQLGQRVTFHPYQGCGQCAHCQQAQPEHCPAARMLGVDRDGVFAEYVCLAARSCYLLPAGLSWQKAAYTEPLAAALGVLKAGLKPTDQGLVLGQNRIAELTRRVLRAAGIEPLPQTWHELPPASLDYAIESGLPGAELPALLQRLKPGGLLILKSRHLAPGLLPWQDLVRRELRLQGLYYGRFEQALDWLARDLLPLDDLFGKTYPLHAYAEFLASDQEQSKRFLELTPCVASLQP